MEEEKSSIAAPAYDITEEWVQNYVEQFGMEPSFF